jgi:sarcosine oxidase subunit beta
VGEVIRDIYLGREPVVDVRPLSATRFMDGTLRGEVNIV